MKEKNVFTRIFQALVIAIFISSYFYLSSLPFIGDDCFFLNQKSYSLANFVKISYIISFLFILPVILFKGFKFFSNKVKISVLIISLLFFTFYLYIVFSSSDINFNILNLRNVSSHLVVFISVLCLFISCFIVFLTFLLKHTFNKSVNSIIFVVFFSIILTFCFQLRSKKDIEKNSDILLNIILNNRDFNFENQCVSLVDNLQNSLLQTDDFSDENVNKLVNEHLYSDIFFDYQINKSIENKEVLTNFVNNFDTIYLSKNLIYLDDKSFGTHYLGVVFLPENQRLFLDFYKDFYLNDGEILIKIISENNLYISDFSHISFANYKDGLLQYSHGNFNFPLEMNKINDKNYSFFNKNIDQNKDLVIAYHNKSFVQNIAPFSFIAILLIILILMIKFITDELNIVYPFNSIYRRLNLFSIVLLILTLGIISTVTAYFINDRETSDLEKIQLSLTNLIAQDLQKEYNKHTDIFIDDAILLKNKRNFAKEITLYSLDGRFINSTKTALYLKTGSFNMNSESLDFLSKHPSQSFLTKERYGDYTIRSSYSVLHGFDGKPLCYVNVLDFRALDELDELISFFVTYFNIVFILSLFATFVLVIVLRHFLRPLMTIKNHLTSFQLGKKNDKISYSGSDEIGSIAKVYNELIVKLEENATQLAIYERETAWRDVARQVAHEINNPLTPLKIKTQLLLNDEPNLSENTKKYLENVLHYVDMISSIVGSFNKYTKTPEITYSKFSLSQIVDSIRLYDTKPNIKFSITFTDCEVYSDINALTHVVGNIIKNSVQALEDQEDGVIKVGFERKDDDILITIFNNGPEIPQEIRSKIFMPNFTTKQSGSGIGLYLASSILRSLGGSIDFDCPEAGGTFFFIRFPVEKSMK